MMGDHQSRCQRNREKIPISAEAWKIEVDQPTLEGSRQRRMTSKVTKKWLILRINGPLSY